MNTWHLKEAVGCEANEKRLGKVLQACGEIEELRKETCELRGEVKSLKGALDFADKDITDLKGVFFTYDQT